MPFLRLYMINIGCILKCLLNGCDFDFFCVYWENKYENTKNKVKCKP